MRRIVLAAIATLLASGGVATTADHWRAIARDLGDIVGSEVGCPLVYDRSAMMAYITGHVPTDDSTSFLEMMAAHSGAIERRLAILSQSEKTTHCTRVRRLAKIYGFDD